MSAAIQYADQYDYQQAVFWSRKKRELAPEEFEALVVRKKVTPEILKKAVEMYETTNTKRS